MPFIKPFQNHHSNEFSAHQTLRRKTLSISAIANQCGISCPPLWRIYRTVAKTAATARLESDPNRRVYATSRTGRETQIYSGSDQAPIGLRRWQGLLPQACKSHHTVILFTLSSHIRVQVVYYRTSHYSLTTYLLTNNSYPAQPPGTPDIHASSPVPFKLKELGGKTHPERHTIQPRNAEKIRFSNENACHALPY